MLPFTVDEFFAVFARYNQAIWPAQVVAYVLAVVTLGLVLLRPGDASGRVVSTILALLWLWTGVAYHAIHFAPINPAAWLFAVVFMGQGLLLLREGAWRGRLRFAPARGPEAAFGWLLAGYATVLYPLVGAWTGHVFPEAPTFGVTPCPVTLFSVGLLLLTSRPVPGVLLVVPASWSMIGGSAAFLLRVPQDWMLLVGGLAGIAAIVIRDRASGAK
ncbi:MAG TPA: DUF6064 family protein [Arenibaculum sp.]|nr:DUF6064 family protein [Arenibaculum sp.]